MWTKGVWGVQVKSRFRSRSEHTLDSKGRLSFPSRFRDVLRHFDSDILMVTTWGNHLRVFPVAEWEQLEEKLLTKGKEQKRMGSFVRLIVSGVNECSLDKQGRLQLPQALRNEANLKKDVVLTGMLDWVEIWDKDAWVHEHQSTQSNFEDFEDKLSELGIF